MVLAGEIEGALYGVCITGVPRHHCELKQFKYTQELPVLFDNYSTPKQTKLPSLKLTEHMKIGFPKRKVNLQPSIFRCYVSFREGKTFPCLHVNPLANSQMTAPAVETRNTCIKKQLPIKQKEFQFHWNRILATRCSNHFRKSTTNPCLYMLRSCCCFCHAAAAYDHYGLYT